ncbi:uncharacterized protein LOC119166907 isoform X2 [Rhipicephalus microplus]|uniref:uncharacterized protein LOC119166907 isoform X2 n=1 Tax=Rhipicephalus microplus TaxID=6941 RepID=UPI003F6C0D42
MPQHVSLLHSRLNQPLPVCPLVFLLVYLPKQRWKRGTDCDGRSGKRRYHLCSAPFQGSGTRTPRSILHLEALHNTSHQTYNKEPERRLGETCITRTACELGDAHSDCIHWQCQCKKGFRIEFLHGIPVCVTGFFPSQCYSHNQCIEMDEHALCVSNVCDCENGYQRELIYWKYVCRPEKSDKSLIIFILSFTLLLLIIVLLYIGKHYVQSECAGPPNPPCPASSTITGFTGSIQDADSPEWDLVVIPRAVRPPSPVLPSKEDLPPSYEEVMRYLSQQSSKR